MNYKIKLTFLFFLMASSVFSQEVPLKLEFAGLTFRLNNRIQQNIQNRVNLLTEDKQAFKEKARVADNFLPLVSDILKDFNLPDDLKYLAMLDNTAPDSLIFWQMAKEFADEIGLKINNEIDERQNIITATRQVATFLKKKQANYGNWMLALLSYHLNPGELANYLQKAFGQFKLTDFTKLKSLELGSETHPDILQLLANFIAFKNQLGYNTNLKRELVSFNDGNNKSLRQIASEFALPISELIKYNQWLKTDKIPTDKKYDIVIPMPAQSPSADVNIVTAPNGSFIYETENQSFLHIVEQGETLYGIARNYQINAKDLMQWNKMNNNSKLMVGQKLIVNAPSDIKKAETIQQTTKIHTVGKGETLFRIAKQYAVSVSNLKTWNDLLSDNLALGQKLKINVKKNETPKEVIKDVEIPKEIPKDKEETPIKIDNTSTNTTKRYETKNGVRVVKPKKVPAILMFAGIQLNITSKGQQVLQKDVDFLLKGQLAYLERLKKVDLYFPLVVENLKSASLPEEFKYLPVQESALVGNAISKSNAVGYWQFKEEAARECEIPINGSVDERMHIISSTIAATKYLKRNQLYFQNWLNTLLSYNLGFTGAKNYIALNYPNQNLKNAKTMEINENTHWYIRKFLAHKIAFEMEIGLETLPKILDTYIQSKNKSLAEIAQETANTTAEIKPFNLWLKQSKVPTDKTYHVIVPVRK